MNNILQNVGEIARLAASLHILFVSMTIVALFFLAVSIKLLVDNHQLVKYLRARNEELKHQFKITEDLL